MDTKHYSMNIQWSDEDQAYIVTVPELPGCRTHGEIYEEAAKQGQDAIDSWINDVLTTSLLPGFSCKVSQLFTTIMR